jgi:sugar lactone lactonase YvrE
MRIKFFAAVGLFLASLAVAKAADLIFSEGSEWELVSDGHQFAEGMAWDKEGHFYFTDVPRSLLYKVDAKTGERILIDDNTGRANGIAFGPDGRIYAWDPVTWGKVAVATGPASNDIAILKDGTIFFTDPGDNNVWRIDPKSGELTKAADPRWMPNGISLSLDQKTLLVAEFNSGTIHGFSIDSAGQLKGKSSPAYRLGIPSNTLGRLDGMQPLKDGRLLIGTALGMQIAPRVGKEGTHPLIVVPSPDNRPRCNYARISPDGQWLYAAFAKDILRRRVVEGFNQ